MRDGWRLAVGTLTVVPVRAPLLVDSATARWAVLLAPLAAVPLGLAVVVVALAGPALGLPPLVVAFLSIGILALGTRALHWDGLSDTADGLTASYDRARSLEVMKGGTSGPAGVVATVVVAGLQVAALSSLVTTAKAAVVAGLAVCGSRAALAITCRRGVPAARADGLGQPMAGVVPGAAAALSWSVLAGLLAAAVHWSGGPWWQGVAATVVAGATVVILVRRAVARLGGVTGDVFGAAVELCLAALLVSLS